jgi:Carboxypeptidase regulatory-like domain/TonB dependent receptor/TonB-dependent Receptor Plug Domain
MRGENEFRRFTVVIQSKLKKIGVNAGFILTASVFMLGQANAQVSGATLSGTVRDSSGAVVPQTQISIKNVATSVETPVTANQDGLYSAPNLLPGPYEVTASSPGFSAVVRTGIVLTVGDQQLLNFTLQVGQVAQKVEVTGDLSSVQMESSTISNLVNAQTVVDLPLNGRDWTQLAALQPGVVAITTQQPLGGSSSRSSRGNGAQMSISGTRPQLNNYRLDGISIIDFAGGSPGSALGIALGVDAIAEFSVLTSNSTAEYGRTSGGVINAITKSGTNQFHGDAYEFLRNGVLDARNYFDIAANPKPPFKRNQFGVAVGGPIQKGKTFFFADYEGFRQSLGVTNINIVPSPDARNGIVHNADGTIATLTVDNLVKPFLAFYPLPNSGLLAPGNTGDFDIAVDNISREDFVTTRIDRKFSEKDSVAGSWFYDKGSSDVPDSFDDVLVGDTSFRQMIALEETHVFNSSLVNTARGGYSRVNTADSFSLRAIKPIASDTSFGAFPGQPAPQIYVSGLSTLSASTNAIGAVLNYWNSFQAYDDAFLIKGKHSLKFGFAFERMQSNFRPSPGDNGVFKFGSLTNFLTNQPSSFTSLSSIGASGRGVRQSLIGGYIQDDWRWRPNLTLNLGLRYEAVSVPTEVQGKLVNLPTFESPTPHLGSPYFSNPTKRDFEPRVGFAWDPFHKGKTSVRGAFGIFDALPLNYEFEKAEQQSAPFAVTLTLGKLPAGSFPTGAVDIILSKPIVPSELQSASIEANPGRNYLMIWNLNIQQQLAPSATLLVGYVGNHGVHMLNRADDVNMVLPTLTPQGYLWPSPVGSGTVLNTNVGDIRGEYWTGTSLYDALEVELTKRMSHGFQVETSYTWGKNIDTGSASNIGDPFVNSISSPLFFCPRCRRGLSDYDIAHAFKISYLWNISTPQNWGAVASHALGGWEVGGIVTAESGVPFTPLIGGDPLGQNSTDPFGYPNRIKNASGCHTAAHPGNATNYINLDCFTVPDPITLLGNEGRNSITGPGLVGVDFSLFKNNPIRKISETFNAQFRAEFFNVLNRPNFAPPIDNDALFDQNGNPVAGAGAVDMTSTTSRQIQFALKLIF